jgi:hypothetical protein
MLGRATRTITSTGRLKEVMLERAPEARITVAPNVIVTTDFACGSRPNDGKIRVEKGDA